MATVVKSFAIQGIDGYGVDIETKMLEGQPMISIIGMGDVAVKEAGDRIQSAIDESGYVFPKKRIIISLAPGDKKKRGSHFDLAMAIGVLQENSSIGVKSLDQYGFIGELCLDGGIRGCSGILPMILAAKKNGIKKIIIPAVNSDEAKLVQGIERILDACDKENISILKKYDLRYPYKARILDDAPAVLYYQGQLKNLEHTVGIVGARRCDQDTKKCCYELTEKYVRNNWTIVSGMAKGIDACAHTVCINTGGYTVAILGNGLDICYPQEHRILMDKIKEKGLLLSEYPPGTRPTKYAFPRRNRLISAWSDKVVVIGAGKGSGAFITEEYAGKYGRKVENY